MSTHTSSPDKSSSGTKSVYVVSILRELGAIGRQTPHWVFDLLGFGVIAMLIAIVLGSRFDYGVVPHDMGTIGHAAERVLNGEFPHVDFDDPYTGLLSLLNAGAFRLWGISLISTRLLLLVGTMFGFGAAYLLCRRIAPIWVAIPVTAAAFLASVPNYFSSMPTWHNLYCTLGGLAAMTYYADARRLRWVFVAGVCTGVSFLFKSVGIYLLPAAALFAVFVEQRRSEAALNMKRPAPAYASWLTILGLGAYATVPATLISAHLDLTTVLTFVAPSLVLVVYLSWNERRLRRCEPLERLRRLVRIGFTFVAGALPVVSLYLVPYFVAGGVKAWGYGVFVRPMTRLEDELLSRPLDVESYLSGVLLWILIAFIAALARESAPAVRWMSAAAAGVGIVLLFAARVPEVYGTLWSAARLTPLAIGPGLCLHLRSKNLRTGRKRFEDHDDSQQVEAAFLLTATAGVFGLMQFPIAHGIYFLYVAPVVVVAVSSVLTVLYPAQRLPSLLFAGWVIAFASLWMLPGRAAMLGVEYQASRRAIHIDAERCPTLCDVHTAHEYSELINEVNRRAPGKTPILAIPDSPEVYFLTGRRNPTRTFFDAFDLDYGTPARDARLLQTLEDQQVHVVVMRNLIEFSPQALNPSFWKVLMQRFPYSRPIVSGGFAKFTVYWRTSLKPSRPNSASPMH
jgi:hypothetical protein